MDRSLDIVLPCYNPSPGWENTIVANIVELRSLITGTVHLTLVNDGSISDFSEAIAYLKAEIKDFTYIHQTPNGGKGKALRTGIARTTSNKVIFTDIDFPYTTKSFISIYKELSNHDVVIGVRDKSYYENIPSKRRFISRVLKQVNKTLLRLPSSDTQGGLKGMTSAGRAIFLQTDIDRYLIDLDFLKRVGKSTLRFKEQVVQLRKGIEVSEMGYSILIDEMRNFLKILFR